MAKKTHSVQVKGVLDVDFNSGVGRIIEITKDEEIPYDLFEIINEFNGKSVTLTLKEDQDLQPIEE